MAELTTKDFVWNGYFWETTVTLPVWRGFRNSGGSYGSRDSQSPSDGSTKIVFAPEGREDGPLRDDEVQLVRWAVEHAAEMQQSLLDGLLAEYPSIEENYSGSVEPEELPPIQSTDDFKPLIGLTSMNVHLLEHLDLPYVGFEFGCSWDDEHGLGVLMHGTRVVEIGGADTAILLWIAEADAGAGEESE